MSASASVGASNLSHRIRSDSPSQVTIKGEIVKNAYIHDLSMFQRTRVVFEAVTHEKYLGSKRAGVLFLDKRATSWWRPARTM